jgi:hypothetical protein
LGFTTQFETKLEVLRVTMSLAWLKASVRSVVRLCTVMLTTGYYIGKEFIVKKSNAMLGTIEVLIVQYT